MRPMAGPVPRPRSPSGSDLGPRENARAKRTRVAPRIRAGRGLSLQVREAIREVKGCDSQPRRRPHVRRTRRLCSLQRHFCEERTVTFDFDLHDRADPARDVARFLIPLERLARRGLRSAGAQEGTARIFLDAYLASGGQRVEDQLPLHRAAACLRRAERAVKAGAFEWRERTEAILDEGLRTLERPVGKGNGWLCSDGEN